MICRSTEDGYRTLAPGISMKSLVHGEATHLVCFRLQAGADLPVHRHDNEQTGYLVRGSIELLLGAERVTLGPGDSWSIPAGVEHGARVLEDAEAVEVFSPVRPEYL